MSFARQETETEENQKQNETTKQDAKQETQASTSTISAANVPPGDATKVAEKEEDKSGDDVEKSDEKLGSPVSKDASKDATKNTTLPSAPPPSIPSAVSTPAPTEPTEPTKPEELLTKSREAEKSGSSGSDSDAEKKSVPPEPDLTEIQKLMSQFFNESSGDFYSKKIAIEGFFQAVNGELDAFYDDSNQKFTNQFAADADGALLAAENALKDFAAANDAKKELPAPRATRRRTVVLTPNPEETLENNFRIMVMKLLNLYAAVSKLNEQSVDDLESLELMKTFFQNVFSLNVTKAPLVQKFKEKYELLSDKEEESYEVIALPRSPSTSTTTPAAPVKTSEELEKERIKAVKAAFLASYIKPAERAKRDETRLAKLEKAASRDSATHFSFIDHGISLTYSLQPSTDKVINHWSSVNNVTSSSTASTSSSATTSAITTVFKNVTVLAFSDYYETNMTNVYKPEELDPMHINYEVIPGMDFQHHPVTLEQLLHGASKINAALKRGDEVLMHSGGEGFEWRVSEKSDRSAPPALLLYFVIYQPKLIAGQKLTAESRVGSSATTSAEYPMYPGLSLGTILLKAITFLKGYFEQKGPLKLDVFKDTLSAAEWNDILALDASKVATGQQLEKEIKKIGTGSKDARCSELLVLCARALHLVLKNAVPEDAVTLHLKEICDQSDPMIKLVQTRTYIKFRRYIDGKANRNIDFAAKGFLAELADNYDSSVDTFNVAFSEYSNDDQFLLFRKKYVQNPIGRLICMLREYDATHHDEWYGQLHKLLNEVKRFKSKSKADESSNVSEPPKLTDNRELQRILGRLDRHILTTFASFNRVKVERPLFAVFSGRTDTDPKILFNPKDKKWIVSFSERLENRAFIESFFQTADFFYRQYFSGLVKSARQQNIPDVKFNPNLSLDYADRLKKDLNEYPFPTGKVLSCFQDDELRDEFRKAYVSIIFSEQLENIPFIQYHRKRFVEHLLVLQEAGVGEIPDSLPLIRQGLKELKLHHYLMVLFDLASIELENEKKGDASLFADDSKLPTIKHALAALNKLFETVCAIQKERNTQSGDKERTPMTPFMAQLYREAAVLKVEPEASHFVAKMNDIKKLMESEPQPESSGKHASSAKKKGHDDVLEDGEIGKSKSARSSEENALDEEIRPKWLDVQSKMVQIGKKRVRSLVFEDLDENDLLLNDPDVANMTVHLLQTAPDQLRGDALSTFELKITRSAIEFLMTKTLQQVGHASSPQNPLPTKELRVAVLTDSSYLNKMIQCARNPDSSVMEEYEEQIEEKRQDEQKMMKAKEDVREVSLGLIVDGEVQDTKLRRRFSGGPPSSASTSTTGVPAGARGGSVTREGVFSSQPQPQPTAATPGVENKAEPFGRSKKRQ